MKTADAVRAMSRCPRCGAAIDKHCYTATGRNHNERVVASIRAALEELQSPSPPASSTRGG